MSQVDAIDGLFAIVKPTSAIPGPIKPIDCRDHIVKNLKIVMIQVYGRKRNEGV